MAGPRGERLPGIKRRHFQAETTGEGGPPWRAAPRNLAPSQEFEQNLRATLKNRVCPAGRTGPRIQESSFSDLVRI